MSGNSPVLVVTTGGTIDKVYFDAGSDYEVGVYIVMNGQVFPANRVRKDRAKNLFIAIDPD